MEIPSDIKVLYRHWDLHVERSVESGAGPQIPAEFAWFIEERLNIWKKKVMGESPPYTTDDILGRYRFCNVLRECDRQTLEFHRRLNPLRDNFPLWLLNMFACRLIARPETIECLGLLSYDQAQNEAFYERLLASPRPRFGTPYVFPVSVIQKSATPTRESFIAHALPALMPAVAREIAVWREKSVYEGVQIILPIFGFNLSFLWTEVLIDVAYQFPEYVSLLKRFPLGPGSRPTFLKIAPPGQDLSLFVTELGAAHVPIDVTYNGRRLILSPENWEGLGCEFRKYTNLKQGKGRRRIFMINYEAK